jgi:hypothetical protein
MTTAPSNAERKVVKHGTLKEMKGSGKEEKLRRVGRD